MSEELRNLYKAKNGEVSYNCVITKKTGDNFHAKIDGIRDLAFVNLLDTNSKSQFEHHFNAETEEEAGKMILDWLYCETGKEFSLEKCHEDKG